MEHRKAETSVDEIQRKMIEQIVQFKMNSILSKFEDLDKRLAKVENQINLIYEKIERSIQNINREEIKKNVESLFQRVTPQFESYFNEVFRQISGVLDQGTAYYTAKLNK